MHRVDIVLLSSVGSKILRLFVRDKIFCEILMNDNKAIPKNLVVVP